MLMVVVGVLMMVMMMKEENSDGECHLTRCSSGSGCSEDAALESRARA